MEPSTTAYDDSFRTLLNDCRELIIPVVNEVFGEKLHRERRSLLHTQRVLSEPGWWQ